MLLNLGAIESLNLNAGLRVELLTANARSISQQGLTYKFMGEGEGSLRPFGTRDGHSQALRPVDDVEKFIDIHLAHRGQKLKAETSPENRCRAQSADLRFTETFEAPGDNQSHVIRDINLIDLQVTVELSGAIEDSSFLNQMPVQLHQEERIAVGFLINRAHEKLGKLTLAHAAQDL